MVTKPCWIAVEDSGFWSSDHNQSSVATGDDSQEHQHCGAPITGQTTRLTEDASQKFPNALQRSRGYPQRQSPVQPFDGR